MEKARNIAVDAMEKLSEGAMPIKTGDAIHKLCYSQALDMHADCRMTELVSEKDRAENLQRVTDAYKEMK
jgi:hypothetical protein